MCKAVLAGVLKIAENEEKGPPLKLPYKVEFAKTEPRIAGCVDQLLFKIKS